MRFKKLGIVLCIFIACITVLAGCVKVKGEGTPTSVAAAASDPIIAEWSMVRAGIEPSVPVPDVLVNQVVPEKSTWKFQRSNGKLVLRCDGNDTWYKIPIGVTVNKKAVNVSESSGSYKFSGGGSIDLSGASMIISQIMGQKIEQATAEFSDENAVSFTQGSSSIKAVIAVNASGKYYGEMETGGMKWKSIQQKMTITYNGVKK
jgi:hypothetical protein